jgi:hypothetical protein
MAKGKYWFTFSEFLNGPVIICVVIPAKILAMLKVSH